jgi:uncharacterized phage protein (TIGR01671 family)
MRPLGLVDKNGEEMHESDITELEVSGIKRRFVVKTGTVIREVKSHPSFDDDFAKVAITGVYFEWQGYQLFPCVDGSGVSDVAKMTVIGNIYEHPHLLPNREEQ